MRTTFDIPAKLLDEAKRLSGSKTKNRVVVIAVEDFVRRKRLERLFDRAIDGRFKFDNADFSRLRHER